MGTSNFIFIYVTYPDHEMAARVSSLVIENRLAACANILPQVTSMYEWNQKIETSSEVIAIYKTTEDCFEKLKTMIIENHSYECPCVVAIPITQGHPEFLQWIETQTK